MASGKSGKKDWRGGGRSASVDYSLPRETMPGYMQRPDRREDVEKWAFRRKLALWATLFLTLVGVLLYVIIWWPRRPPLVIAAITNYNYPLPPNGWAEEDRNLLMRLEGDKIVRCRAVEHDKGEVEDYDNLWLGLSEKAAFDRLEKRLREAEDVPGGPNKNVVMLYVNMHGAVRAGGEPCLVPPGPFAHDSSKWFSAKALLVHLFGKGADDKSKLKKRLKYLVFFDCGRVDADWNLGWLYAGFPQRLGETLRDLALGDNLYIITSSSPGQVSWTAPELQGSVFARYLYRGLLGRADKFGTEQSNKTVTLKKLFRYLKANVSGWVKVHRDDEQTPMLFGAGGEIEADNFPAKDDFPVVGVGGQPLEDRLAPDAGQSSDKWDKIGQEWKRHKKLQGSAARRSPLKWQNYQHHLLYLDQLALAGKVGEAKIADQLTYVGQLADELERPDVGENWPGYSLPQAEHLMKKSRRPAASVSMPQAAAPAGSEAAKPPETPAETAAGKPVEKAADKQPEKVAGAPGAEPAQKPADKPAGQANASAAGDAAGKPPADNKPGAVAGDAKDNPTAGDAKNKETRGEDVPAVVEPSGDYLSDAEGLWQRLAAAPAGDLSLVERLPSLPPARKADLVEMHFLRMLKEYRGQASAQETWRAINSRKLAEGAAWPADPRAQYAIYLVMQEADGHRRLAEDRFFVGGTFPEGDSPQDHWARANGTRGYAAAAQIAKDVAQAFGVRDEALEETSGYARWLLHRGQRELARDKELRELRELIDKTNAFSANLDGTLEDFSTATAPLYEWPEGRKAEMTKVAHSLDALRKAFEKECDWLDKRNEGSPKNEFRRIAAVLSVGLESGERRNRLRGRYRDILRDSAADVGKEEPEANANKASPPKTGQLPGQDFVDRWPTHPALLLLGESWSGNAKEEPAAVLAVQGQQVREKLNAALDEASVDKWCAKARKALADHRTATPLTVRSGLAEGDLAGRTVAALWAGRDLPRVNLWTELRRVRPAEPAPLARPADLP